MDSHPDDAKLQLVTYCLNSPKKNVPIGTGGLGAKTPLKLMEASNARLYSTY
jgi:hypothetical protein